MSGSPKELVWPPPIAPFSVGLLPPKKGSKEETPEVVDAAADLIHRLSSSASASSGDLVVDDRIELTIGRRLADLKRIGKSREGMVVARGCAGMNVVARWLLV